MSTQACVVGGGVWTKVNSASHWCRQKTTPTSVQEVPSPHKSPSRGGMFREPLWAEPSCAGGLGEPPQTWSLGKVFVTLQRATDR